jgi:hypothetical protein
LKKRLQTTAFILLVFLVFASAFTHPRASGEARKPLLFGAQVDPQVLAIIQRACHDCHSGATYYPWYAYIAPISWLIERDVNRGREHLNLNKWNDYSVLRQERLLSEIANQVRDGDMPLPLYTLMHRESRLSETDVDAIFQWTQRERSRLIESTLGK